MSATQPPDVGVGGDIMKMFEGPDDSALDKQQRATLEAIRGAFRELEKLVKNIGLYGEGHQSVDRFRTSLGAALGMALKGRSRVELRVSQYEFALYEQSIYENPNPEGNFIYKFYLDGIRRLIFLEGVPTEEVNEFLDILMLDWTDPALFEDDTVTMLWTKQFKFIDYAVVDSFSDDTREAEHSQYTVAGVLSSVRQRGAVSADDPSERGSGRAKRLVVPKDPRLTLPDLERFEESPFAMDEVEFETLRTQIRSTDRETLEKFIEIVFKVSMIEQGKERDERIVGLFDRIADLLLRTGRIGELERFLRKVRRLTGREGEILRENVEAIHSIFRHWSTEHFVRRMMAGINDNDFIFTPSVVALCHLLNREAAPYIAMEAGRIRHAQRRQAILEVVPHRMKGHEAAIAKLLTKVDQAHAHDLFRILNKAEPKIVFAAIQAGLHNDDDGVRFEALSALQPEMVQRSMSLLFRALEDSSKNVRSKAIHLVARVAHPDVHKRILQRIDDRDFQNYELDEKRRYYAAAALTGDSSAKFMDQFSSGGLLTRKGQDEIRHCAAVALAVRLYKPAIEAFDKELKRRLKSDLVNEAVAWALQHVAADRSARTRQLYSIFYQGTLSAEGGQSVG